MVSGTLLPPRVAAARLPAAAEYRGNHTAFEREGYQRRYWLAGGTAQTPEAAMEWMRHRVWETAVQLDGPAQRPAMAWLSDTGAQQAALQRLEGGRPVTFTLTDDQARYEVFVQPVYGASTRPVPHVRPLPQPSRRRHATPRGRPTAFGLRRWGSRRASRPSSSPVRSQSCAHGVDPCPTAIYGRLGDPVLEPSALRRRKNPGPETSGPSYGHGPSGRWIGPLQRNCPYGTFRMQTVAQ